ncbi:MAG TPA: prepilin-type N-terminal cleavage/methylation domain-containing protein [Planctomycetota bacterium]|nr:prepilin-type N-terminal cleavage/methylation domain-containing protein [Planctomycetota bacterium]
MKHLREQRSHARRRGLTVVELVIAVGLLALLMTSVFAVMRGFIGVWNKSELRRLRVEGSSAVGEMLNADLSALDGGGRGDLVAEYVAFDSDGDGTSESIWPRLRLVRHASAADFARLQARSAEKMPDQGLLEVVWCVVPAVKGKKELDRRSEGLLLRAERIAAPRGGVAPPAGGEVSFFDPRFFSKSGEPTPGVMNEVTAGVLWLGLEFATQTTSLRDGWHQGDQLSDSCPSWDAWRKARPDTLLHVWNEPGAGMPKAKKRALLPRRVKVELELERPKEAARRTRLAEVLELGANTMRVDDEQRLPETPGAFVKIDGEWLKLGAVNGRTVGVQRGMRGSRATNHDRGARIHYGETYLREIPIRLAQEDWDL